MLVYLNIYMCVCVCKLLGLPLSPGGGCRLGGGAVSILLSSLWCHRHVKTTPSSCDRGGCRSSAIPNSNWWPPAVPNSCHDIVLFYVWPDRKRRTAPAIYGSQRRSAWMDYLLVSKPGDELLAAGNWFTSSHSSHVAPHWIQCCADTVTLALWI